MNQRSHEQALGDLKTFLLQGSSLTLITGSTQLQRQSLLADVLQQQSQSQPILQIHNHDAIDPQSLNSYFSQQWQNINSRPNMSLEQQLQATLDHLNAQRASCIAIADNAEQLPFSVLAAFAHLAMQQNNKPNTCMHIILLGDHKLCDKMQQFIHHEHLQHIELTDNPSQTGTPLEPLTINIKKPITTPTPTRPHIANQPTPEASTIAHRSIWQQHSTRITAWSLLVLLCVGLWEYNHHQSPRIPTPLIPNKTQLTQSTHKDNPFQAEGTSVANTDSSTKPAATQQPIKTPTHPASPVPTTHTTLATTTSPPSQPFTHPPATPNKVTTPPAAHAAIARTRTPTPATSQPVVTPQTQYTLQFASSHDKHALSQLQQQLQIPNSHITEVVQNNTIHFVLLAGQYPSIHAAKIARDQLPPQALQQQPWVRPMESTTQTMQTHS